MENIVKLTNLTKSFGSKKAVDNVDMNIYKGDIYGFIGRNGAGKTTLIRILLGLCEKDNGNIKLFDSDDLLKGRDKIGCIIENPGFFPKMTAKNNILAQSKVMGVEMSDQEADHLLDLVGLDPNMKKKTKDFSLGMKQRLAIALSLVGNPKLLVLDEPTNGLDPEGIRDVRNLILKLNRETGLTVLVSSHILSELHKFATRYGIIDNGKLVKEITSEDLESQTTGGFEIICKIEDVENIKTVFEEKNVKYDFDSSKNRFLIFDLSDYDSLLKELTLQGIIPVSYHTVNTDLEDYFLKLIGGLRNE